MATPRSSQAHQKRVQKIAEDAATKIAADAPFEEDVLVVVEELPPGDSSAPISARATSVEAFPGAFDARHLMQEGFRLAEELLASQREFALRVVEAMTPAKAAELQAFRASSPARAQASTARPQPGSART